MIIIRNGWRVFTPSVSDTTINPAETGFYYVSSRYYDPEIGRFLNADAFLLTGQDISGANMYAYCNNNPVNMTDNSGQSPVLAILVTGLVILTGIVVVVNMPSKDEHYARNDNQIDIPSKPEEIINSEDWEEQDDSVNRYHRHPNGSQGNDAADNKKYMTKDKRKEVIINFTDPFEPKIVTDPFNMGTYNYGTNLVAHAIKDVIPYWIWGNTPEDSSYRYLWDRIMGVD